MANNDNSILVTKYIRKFIVENEEVSKLINTNNVFPLIANADTTFPFVVYGRTSLVPTYTKDLLTENSITIYIYVVSDNYIESLEIANAIRHSIESHIYKDDKITIDVIKLESITEETSDDAYIQKMSFTFTCR